MKKLKAWVAAARLRTLPLSLSGIFTGTALANHLGANDAVIFLYCALITIGFQITSNFANDFGDGIKGTDSDDRIGPKRALQSGLLTPKELKIGIAVTAILSLLLAIGLLVHVFGIEELPYFMLFLGLGVFSIWAAIKYTVGSSAYGYRGLGDVFVFIFFGLLAVLGSQFLYTKVFYVQSVLPAIAIGLLCVGVLNLNNLRDIISDKAHGKNTLVVKMGFKNGKFYHALLLVFSFVAFAYFAWQELQEWQFLFLLPYLVIGAHTARVLRTKEPVNLDPELKKLALSTFLLSFLLYLSVNYFL